MLSARQTVGWYLHKARVEANIRQQRLATMLGFSQSKVSRLETATRGVSVHDINLWMDATNGEQAWRDEAIRLTNAVTPTQRTFKLSPQALEAIAELANFRGTYVLEDEVVSEALVFTRDTIVRLGSWRTHPLCRED